MNQSNHTKHSPILMGFIILAGLLLFLSLSIARTSASPAESFNHLYFAQQNQCGELENGDFEAGFSPWTATGSWEIDAGLNGNGLSVLSPFVKQEVAALENQAFVLSGFYKTEGEFGGNWTGIGVDYLNGSTEIDEASMRITDAQADYVQFEISGTTPAGTTLISVWLYTNNNVTLMVDDLVLEWDDCDTTPPPTQTPWIIAIVGFLVAAIAALAALTCSP